MVFSVPAQKSYGEINLSTVQGAMTTDLVGIANI